jgi:hypothetical protein
VYDHGENATGSRGSISSSFFLSSVSLLKSDIGIFKSVIPENSGIPLQ